MLKKYTQYVVLLALVVLLSGCASTNYSRGSNALKDQNYRVAISELKKAVAENPKNLDAIRDLGIALYEMGNKKLSKRLLAIVALRKPDDPVTAYYLGQIYEDAGDIQEAIKYYKRYVNLGPHNPFRKQLEFRLQLLIKKELQSELADMLTRENQLQVASIPDNAIAVLYFLNLTQQGKVSPLQKGLTEMLITDLSQIKGLTLIERARLQALMDEMGLGQTGMINESTAPRIGKLLGASKVVHGTLTQLADKQLRIDAGVTDIKNADIKTTRTSGSLVDLFKLEKDLVFNIIDEMGISISPEERRSIEQVPTKNLVAFMYYCRALDQEDRGFYDDAAISYQRALAKDPGFSAASLGRERTRSLSSFKNAKSKARYAQVTSQSQGGRSGSSRKTRTKGTRNINTVTENSALSDELGSRLDRTAMNVNPGFMPGVESREATTEENTSTFGNSAPISIRIPIPVVNPDR